MMASHRPAEPPPEPLPSPHQPAPSSQPSGPAASGALPESPFLTGFDWILALGVLALAFLIASFTVRNSDFWMHLATGRLLSNGGYTFGKDPFSYVGGDRTWVNHSWLFDWLIFKTFSAGGGPAVVIAKAVAVSLAAGLLLIARRPGSSLFPSVVCVGLALVAAAPRLLLQPTVASLLCLAVLMVLLIRMPKPAGSWRFPIAIGVLFALWANLDQWFFLGTIFLILYTVGHLIRPEENENRVTLLKGLAIGILACMLNPHHVRIWELPIELVDGELAKVVANDPEFGRIFFRAYNKGDIDFSGDRENPANLYSLFGLLALNLAGFVFNFRRLNVGLVMIWVASVVLTLLYLRATPFLAFVAAPIAALDLAAFGSRLATRTFPDRTIRALHALRSGGRATVGLIGLILIALTYPGWLHPLVDQRRWDWEVEPSVSMKSAAEHIQSLRDAGTLPPEARLLNFQPDFANYVAWFAPSEKTYCDYRLRFHREEIADYVALKKYVTTPDPRERQRSDFDFQGFLRRHNVTYAVTVHPQRIRNSITLDVLLADVRNPAHGPEWALWHVAGRAVIMGWTRQTTIPSSSFDRLRFDPVQTLFSSSDLLPTPSIHPPLVARDTWDRFVAAPPATAPEGEESFVLLTYRNTLVLQTERRHRLVLGGVRFICAQLLMTPALNRVVFLRDVSSLSPPPATAIAILSVRAARRAIATSPDHPEGYYHLANCYPAFANNVFNQDVMFNQDVAIQVTTASLARCKARIHSDPAEHRSIVDVVEVCDRLADAFSSQDGSPPRFDLALDAIKMGTDYLRWRTDDLEANIGRLNAEQREDGDRKIESDRRMLAARERRIKEFEAELTKRRQNYINTVASITSPIERAGAARRYGLVREAIEELYKTHAALQKQPQSEEDKRKMSPADSARQLAEHAELIELMLYDGRVEEASQILDSIDTSENMAVMESDPLLRGEYFAIRRRYLASIDPRSPVLTRFDNDPAAHYRALRQGVAIITGDFKAATDVQTRDIQAVRKQTDEFRAQYFPGKMAPISTLPDMLDRQLDQLYRPLFAPLNPIPGFLAGQARLIHVFRAEQLQGMVQTRVNLHARIAMTYLEWGDLKSAIHHFQKALESPELAEPLPQQRIAEEYLKILDPGSKKHGGKP